MRRRHPAKLLRFLVAALVALASFGPRTTHAHSHPVASDGHHDHEGHDRLAQDDHDGPGLSNGVAHVHGSWLGIAIILPALDGESASDSSLSSADGPSLPGNLGKGLVGPLKERIPWPEFFVPPEPFRLSLLAPPSPNPHAHGDGTSYAHAGRTLVLRC